MKTSRTVCVLAAIMAMAVATPALADLDAGYRAWNSGDYTRAVREWRDLATSGNADAQFNMAQAYRQGKGVEQNTKQAEILLAKAAAQGHIKATDAYGLVLFQSGRREQAMPYVIAAAERGNPWAQYLLGIGHFNGDLVAKDWTRAYALMTLSNSAGYVHAQPAIAQMDDFIPLRQRQEAQAMAQVLKRSADAKRAQQIASENLAVAAGLSGTASAPPRSGTGTAAGTPAPVRTVVNRIPQPIPSTAVPPSVAAAQAAVSEAARVTGTESPAQAGADFARPARSAASTRTAQAPRPSPPARQMANPKPRTPAPSRTPTSTASRAAATGGPWKVQLGAFSVRGNADRLWTKLSGRAALKGARKLVVPAGRLVRLQAGGFSSRSTAQSACNSLKRGGQTCLVTR